MRILVASCLPKIWFRWSFCHPSECILVSAYSISLHFFPKADDIEYFVCGLIDHLYIFLYEVSVQVLLIFYRIVCPLVIEL